MMTSSGKPFRERLLSREKLVGTLLTLPSPEVAEILATAGLDWLFIDLEHTPLEPRDAQAILQAVGERAAGVIRVPLNDEIWIKKALDIGAAGVIIPLVNSVAEAQRAVRFCKYPPQGARSVGLARAQGYGADLPGYLARANRDTAVIVQIEHIEAVENIHEILALEGIDALLVGPYDLSASLGRMGAVEHPTVQAAITRVRDACLEQRMPLGIFAASAERTRAYLDQGYTLIAAGSDTLMLDRAARETVSALKRSDG